MKREPGQITVFLSLLSLLIFSLFAVSLEASRQAFLSYLCRQASGSALQSVFADFNSVVLSRYGLLVCDGGSFSETSLQYAGSYFSLDGTPLPGLGEVSIELSDCDPVWITDDNGRIFADEVLSYMKEAGLSLLIQEALARLGIRSFSDLASFCASLSELLGDGSLDLKSILKSFDALKEEAEKKASSAPGAASEDELSVSPSLPPAEFWADAESIGDYLEKLKDLKDHGLIYLLTGKYTLSQAVYGSSLPSALSQEEKSRHAGLGQTTFSLGDKLLLCEFAFHKLGCYTASSDTGCRYELEYLLSGKTTDQDALQDTASQLLLIRTGLNFSYLLSDAAKLEEAEAAALVFAAALGIPELSTAVKWLLVSAWALTEAILDVRCLLAGRKVPLWKSTASWKSGFLELPAEAAGSGSGSGLLYPDYLRLLFYLKQGPELSYRLMDVIQRRTRIYQKDFTMAAQLVSVRADFCFSVPARFLVFPLFSPKPSGRGWKYSKTAEFGYRRR